MTTQYSATFASDICCQQTRVGFLPAETCLRQTWGLNRFKPDLSGKNHDSYGKKLDLSYLMMQTLYTHVMLSLVLKGWINEDNMELR